MIWIIAWKNIWRNKVRSLVVMLAITLGLFGGVFSSAVMKGTGDQRIKEAIARETSHLQIHNPSYTENNEIIYCIDGERKSLMNYLDTALRGNPFSTRIKFLSMAATANASTGIMVFGVDPAKEKEVSEVFTTICDSCGTFLEGDKRNQIVVGEALARKLKIKLRSKLILTFQDIDGNLTGAAFRVGGIYRTNNSGFDELSVYVRKADIAPLLAMDTNEFHEAAIRLRDAEQIETWKEKISAHFPALLVRTWKEVDPLVGVLNDLMNLWLYLFMGIILLALGFGIINTMLMVILERSRELGMLAAIGMNKPRIFFMIMLESVYLSVTGGVTGMLLGYILILVTSHTGINLASFSQGFAKLGYSPVLYPGLDYSFFIILTIMVIFIGILASVSPALKALKQNPAEAVKTE